MPTRHDAFISYSHAADGPIAAALEGGLEQLAKPLLKRRALDVFRDQTSLTAAPALWPGIVAHLEASGWLVLLASPQSACSIWCNKEVQWWLDNRSPNRLLVLLTDGEIAWDRAAQDFDWSRTNALPRLLERRCADEPLYVDLRWARSSEFLTLRHARFRDAVVSIAAPIRGVAKDELDGADLRQLARNRMLVRGGVAAITVAAVVAVWQAVAANRQRTEAERQRDIAVSRQLAAQAELMRVQQPDRLPLALLMAAQALRGQPESLEAQHTLRGLLARIPEPVATFAHAAPVNVARLSRDLEHLATAAEADAGALWSVRNRMRLAPLPGADRTVVWSADDRILAGCCVRVTAWNRAGEPQLQLTERDLNGRAEDIVLSGDGRYLAVGISGENWIGFSVHDIASKTTVLRKQGRGETRGIPIAFAPNGDFFAAVNEEVEWYPAGHWDRPRRLNAGGGDVVRLAVSPDSRQLAVASTSSVSLVSLRQPERPRLLRSSGFGPSDVQELVFSASGAYLGVIPGMGAGAIWAVGSAREIGEPTHGEFYTIHSLSFSPTHAEALTCATDGNCFTWSLADGRRLRQFSHVYAYQADTRDVRALGSGAYAATGTLAVTSGRDKTARLWDLSPPAQEPAKRCDWSTPYISTHVAMSTSWHVTNGPRDPADTACATRFLELSRGVADADATQRFAAVVGERGEVHVWSLRDRRLVATLPHAETASDAGAISVLAISPTGRRVATFRESGRGLRIWDTATAKPLLRETITERDPPHIAFLGDDTVVRIDQQSTLSVVDLGKTATLWSTSAAGLVAFTIDAEGTRLAALTRREQGAVVRLWAATSGQLLLEQAIGFNAGEVKLDRSGQYIVVVGDSPIVPEVPPQPAEVLVLDIASKHAVLELAKDDGTIALDLSRDGSRLAAVSSSGELRVWELPGATVQRAVLATPGPVAFSADGQWVAAGGGSVRVLGASTLRPAAQLEVDGSVLALEFQSDDALLAVRHYTRQSGMTLDAYRWTTEDLLGEACKRIPSDAAARQWTQLLPDEPVPTPCAASGDRNRRYTPRMRLPPVSRRGFLATGGALVAAAYLPDWAEALQSAPTDAARAEAADAALALAAKLGASYADIRVSRYRRESIATRERQVQNVQRSASYGMGLRVLVNGAWGFAATNRVEPAAARLMTEQAVAIARANAVLATRKVVLADTERVTATWSNPVARDPFEVPLETKIAFLMKLNETAMAVKGVSFVNSQILFVDEQKYFASSEGSRITQRLVRTYPQFSVTAADRASGDFQTRPVVDRAQLVGYEYVENYPWLQDAEKAGHEVVEKLKAKPVVPGRYDVVVDPSQLFLAIHESVGHSTELDRALGWEANMAGTSFIKATDAGKLRFGNAIVNLVADRTQLGGLATVGYDDEGVKAERWHLVRDGMFVDWQTTRELAPLVGQTRSHGCLHSDDWSSVPFPRMPNVSLEPAVTEVTLDDLFSGIKRGLFVEGRGVSSIDQQRYNFQFGGAVIREITNGKLGGMVRDAAYQSRTPDFWAACDGIGGKALYKLWGTSADGKGEPGQTNAVSHGCPPARFRNVTVLNTGTES